MVPRVSVIVPAYEVAPYLDRCVRSLLAQTVRDFELILVDDGSHDGTSALCDAWTEADPRVRCVHQENRGLSAARNAGIDLARAELVAFVDADDYVEPRYLEVLLAPFVGPDANPETDISLCGYRQVGCGLSPDLTWSPRQEVLCGIHMLERLIRAPQSGDVVSWNKLYRRRLVEKVRFVEGRIHEDEIATPQLFALARRVACVSDVAYTYVRRPDSITGRASVGMPDQLDAYADALAFVREVAPWLEPAAEAKLVRACANTMSRAILARVRGRCTSADARRAWCHARELLASCPPLSFSDLDAHTRLKVGLALHLPVVYGLLVTGRAVTKALGRRARRALKGARTS